MISAILASAAASGAPSVAGAAGKAVDPAVRLQTAFYSVVLIFLVGALVIVGLFVAFRRSVARRRAVEAAAAERRAAAADRPDLWAVSAARLAEEPAPAERDDDPGEADDPYGLFGGRDPLEPSDDDDDTPEDDDPFHLGDAPDDRDP